MNVAQESQYCRHRSSRFFAPDVAATGPQSPATRRVGTADFFAPDRLTRPASAFRHVLDAHCTADHVRIKGAIQGLA